MQMTGRSTEWGNGPSNRLAYPKKRANCQFFWPENCGSLNPVIVLETLFRSALEQKGSPRKWAEANTQSDCVGHRGGGEINCTRQGCYSRDIKPTIRTPDLTHG